MDPTHNKSPGKVFITNRSHSAESTTLLKIRVCLPTHSMEEPSDADDLRCAFALECDPIRGSYTAGGIEWPCFDHFFQAGKVLKGVNPTYSQEWWRIQAPWQSEYPLATGQDRETQYWCLCSGKCRSRVYYCSCPHHTECEARCNVLIPHYRYLLKQSIVIPELRRRLEQGCDVIIYDPHFKSCRPEPRYPQLDVADETLIDVAVHDGSRTLEYGLLVAAELQGLLQHYPYGRQGRMTPTLVRP